MIEVDYHFRMLDILEKFLIRKGYCFSRLDGSTPANARQTLVDDFNSSPSKQVKICAENHVIGSLNYNCWCALIISGFPYINTSWWAWAESCQCKPCGNIWSKLESCPWFTGPGQVLPLWAEAACSGLPSSCSWLSWRTRLFSASVQAAVIQHCRFWKNGKEILWGSAGRVTLLALIFLMYL